MAIKKIAAAVAALPSGFVRVTMGNFPDIHEFKKTPMLIGTITELKTVETKRGKKLVESRIAYVADENNGGELKGVWESAALHGFFDQVKVGDRICLIYKGMKPIKGQKNPMHDYEIGIQAGTATKGRKARK
jgi:hypothetical protein